MKIKIFLKQNRHLLALFIITVFILSWPVINIFFAEGFKWMGLPTITGAVNGDWKYYEARIREILDGHPFIGNPFSLEHNNELPPAFFFADWLAAIPMLFGLSLEWGTIANDVLWSLLFVFLAYGILRELWVSKIVSIIGAELAYVLVFGLMTSTVSMQTIFPFYLFFLFAFLSWIKDQTNNKKTALLILASTLSFYVYTYLWQITLTMLVIGVIFWFVAKQKEKAAGFLKVIGCTIIFSLPLFALTYLQVTHPDYWDTMQRIGLVQTHLPTAEVFYSGRWVILMILLWFLGFRWSRELRTNQAYTLSLIFFTISGLSLVIVSASNIITGKDLELAMHVGRFILVWMPLAFVSFLSFVKKYAVYFKFSSLYKKIVIYTLCLIYLLGMLAYCRGFLYPFLHRQQIWQHIVDNQKMNAPLNWLESREKTPVVVWTDDSNSVTNGYVTVLTKHYVLAGGVLQLVSSKEVEERYLVSNYFNRLSLGDIKNDFQFYAGIGNAVHPYKVHNRGMILCKFFRLSLFGVDCGEKTDAVSLKGEKYFIDLYEKYTKEIVPNISYYLKKYQVEYFIKDRRVNKNIDAEKIDMKRVYYDDNFEVYKIK